MKYKIYENYLDKKNCLELQNWILEHINTPIFEDANMEGNRLTTRYSDNFEFPHQAISIRDRIIQILCLSDYSFVSFNEGMMADYAMPGDTCYKHTDRVWKEGTITLHCNIKLTDCIGGEPFIEDKIIQMNIGDMLVYPVSIVEHGSNLVKGKNPRLFWMFCFCIKQSDYQRLFNINF